MCCKDLWYLEVETPVQSPRVQLVRASTMSLELCWPAVPTAQYYILEVQKVPPTSTSTALNLPPVLTSPTGASQSPSQHVQQSSQLQITSGSPSGIIGSSNNYILDANILSPPKNTPVTPTATSRTLTKISTLWPNVLSSPLSSLTSPSSQSSTPPSVTQLSTQSPSTAQISSALTLSPQSASIVMGNTITSSIATSNILNNSNLIPVNSGHTNLQIISSLPASGVVSTTQQLSTTSGIGILQQQQQQSQIILSPTIVHTPLQKSKLVNNKHNINLNKLNTAQIVTSLNNNTIRLLSTSGGQQVRFATANSGSTGIAGGSSNATILRGQNNTIITSLQQQPHQLHQPVSISTNTIPQTATIGGKQIIIQKPLTLGQNIGNNNLLSGSSVITNNGQPQLVTFVKTSQGLTVPKVNVIKQQTTQQIITNKGNINSNPTLLTSTGHIIKAHDLQQLTSTSVTSTAANFISSLNNNLNTQSKGIVSGNVVKIMPTRAACGLVSTGNVTANKLLMKNSNLVKMATNISGKPTFVITNKAGQQIRTNQQIIVVTSSPNIRGIQTGNLVSTPGSVVAAVASSPSQLTVSPTVSLAQFNSITTNQQNNIVTGGATVQGGGAIKMFRSVQGGTGKPITITLPQGLQTQYATQKTIQLGGKAVTLQLAPGATGQKTVTILSPAQASSLQQQHKLNTTNILASGQQQKIIMLPKIQQQQPLKCSFQQQPQIRHIVQQQLQVQQPTVSNDTAVTVLAVDPGLVDQTTEHKIEQLDGMWDAEIPNDESKKSLKHQLKTTIFSKVCKKYRKPKYIKMGLLGGGPPSPALYSNEISGNVSDSTVTEQVSTEEIQEGSDMMDAENMTIVTTLSNNLDDMSPKNEQIIINPLIIEKEGMYEIYNESSEDDGGHSVDNIDTIEDNNEELLESQQYEDESSKQQESYQLVNEVETMNTSIEDTEEGIGYSTKNTNVMEIDEDGKNESKDESDNKDDFYDKKFKKGQIYGGNQSPERPVGSPVTPTVNKIEDDQDLEAILILQKSENDAVDALMSHANLDFSERETLTTLEEVYFLYELQLNNVLIIFSLRLRIVQHNLIRKQLTY